MSDAEHAATAAGEPLLEEGRHDLDLRDIRDGELVVTYNRVRHGRSYTEAKHVSGRLPAECLALFRGGTIDVEDLTEEERDWIEFESERIEFGWSA